MLGSSIQLCCARGAAMVGGRTEARHWLQPWWEMVLQAGDIALAVTCE